MSERELNRAVARATGETVEAIQRRGFHLLDDPLVEEAGPLVIDWDTRAPARLIDVVGDDDWPGRTEPLPSYDEEFGAEREEEHVSVAA